jgi:AcrR family transcriptional regulator
MKRDLKRDDLKARLIAAARNRMTRSGLSGLRARDIADEAGCALGSLYNAFADLDDLIFEACAKTLADLDHVIHEASQGAADPREQLLRQGRAYLAFARANGRLWGALFEHRPADGRGAPDWYRANLAHLISHIAGPVGRLKPDLTGDELFMRARTMFAAVHGLVSFSLDNRFIGLPPDMLTSELERLIDMMISGLAVEP